MIFPEIARTNVGRTLWIAEFIDQCGTNSGDRCKHPGNDNRINGERDQCREPPCKVIFCDFKERQEDHHRRHPNEKSYHQTRRYEYKGWPTQDREQKDTENVQKRTRHPIELGTGRIQIFPKFGNEPVEFLGKGAGRPGRSATNRSDQRSGDAVNAIQNGMRRR